MDFCLFVYFNLFASVPFLIILDGFLRKILKILEVKLVDNLLSTQTQDVLEDSASDCR